MDIRLAKISDIESALACIHSASKRNKENYPDEFIDKLNSSFYTKEWLVSKIEKYNNFFIGEIDDTIVVTGSFIKNEIVNIFVRYKFQGRGIGKLIMKFLEEKLAQNNIDTIKLNANLSSVEFYKKIGYTILEPVDEKVENWSIKSFKMIKNIDSSQFH